jgi:hypothetical protein
VSGMEASGYSRWFECLLAELGFEVWIGDPAEHLPPAGSLFPLREFVGSNQAVATEFSFVSVSSA